MRIITVLALLSLSLMSCNHLPKRASGVSSTQRRFDSFKGKWVPRSSNEGLLYSEEVPKRYVYRLQSGQLIVVDTFTRDRVLLVDQLYPIWFVPESVVEVNTKSLSNIAKGESHSEGGEIRGESEVQYVTHVGILKNKVPKLNNRICEVRAVVEGGKERLKIICYDRNSDVLWVSLLERAPKMGTGSDTIKR